jgi:hypothetical protein
MRKPGKCDQVRRSAAVKVLRRQLHTAGERVAAFDEGELLNQLLSCRIVLAAGRRLPSYWLDFVAISPCLVFRQPRPAWP